MFMNDKLEEIWEESVAAMLKHMNEGIEKITKAFSEGRDEKSWPPNS
jgi:hypothetical protein